MTDKLPFKTAFAAIGSSAGMALTSLVLALCLIQKGSVADYGLFAFLLVTQALATGISNALLGSPLLIALSENNTSQASEKIRSFMLANLLLSLLFSLIQAAILLSFVYSIAMALVYAFSAFITTLRWFGRAYCNNSHQHDRVVASDALYSLCSLSAAAILYFTEDVSLFSFGLITATAAILAFPALGINYARLQFISSLTAGLRGFIQGFQQQGKHALVGVLTTEGTLNSHSYLVTLILGPTAFAPIAAASLLFRPVMVVLNSLTQIEKPRIRKLILDSKVFAIEYSLRRFKMLNLLFWSINSIFVIFLLSLFFDVYWKEEHSKSDLVWAAVFFSLIRLSRCISTTYNVYMQAADKFKELSLITIKSSFLTVPLVYVSLLIFEPSFSLAGILLGELFALLLLVRLYQRVKL
ncbi:hypothetical protein [Rheinheimera tangshanensis]|uniref:Oligosaccharide flippase family protein n=1 Tax=Rheinheimera tangshanensis TaxID=400153 RepID=A0A5C8LWH9_9GAMM|nr:hypothetical protein [Rheinheimera tangshanensis]TXK80555.1 hypothetical protein FU839_11425 [Rheinheimera tangshanensis]GGM60349.1 hypothetical protein GCM10010920_21260 [Rheinheimera tangshanensis]